MRTFAIAVALAAVSSPALAEDLRQFDLLCSGERRTDSEEESVAVAATQHLRVDLDRREFCVGECEYTQTIAEITSASIGFRNNTNVSSPVGVVWSQFFVNRESGSYFDQRIFPNRPTSIEEGVCKPAAFSGFPNRPNNRF
jgi:hypothetical protein